MEAFHANLQHKDQIHIPLGSELLAEISKMNLRFKFSLVGMEKGQFLVAKVYPNDLLGTFRSEAIKESNISLSYLNGDTVYEFSSEVLNVVSHPAKMFFMTYPRKIEEVKVRKSTRYDCTLPAMTMVGHEILSVTVVDISKEGCQCLIREQNNGDSLGDLLQVNKRIDLRVQFPGSAHKSEIAGTIRTVTRDQDRIIMGVSFKELRANVQTEVESFISHVTVKRKH
ncbi:MAG: PilZ domain-containing protein [Deltaproteobacteria bacterium]|nr:PilZ domain-containing protein [Deltaproteobacteria bacterium]